MFSDVHLRKDAIIEHMSIWEDSFLPKIDEKLGVFFEKKAEEPEKEGSEKITYRQFNDYVAEVFSIRFLWVFLSTYISFCLNLFLSNMSIPMVFQRMNSFFGNFRMIYSFTLDITRFCSHVLVSVVIGAVSPVLLIFQLLFMILAGFNVGNFSVFGNYYLFGFALLVYAKKRQSIKYMAVALVVHLCATLIGLLGDMVVCVLLSLFPNIFLNGYLPITILCFVSAIYGVLICRISVSTNPTIIMTLIGVLLCLGSIVTLTVSFNQLVIQIFRFLTGISFLRLLFNFFVSFLIKNNLNMKNLKSYLYLSVYALDIIVFIIVLNIVLFVQYKVTSTWYSFILFVFLLLPKIDYTTIKAFNQANYALYAKKKKVKVRRRHKSSSKNQYKDKVRKRKKLKRPFFKIVRDVMKTGNIVEVTDFERLKAFIIVCYLIFANFKRVVLIEQFLLVMFLPFIQLRTLYIVLRFVLSYLLHLLRNLHNDYLQYFMPPFRDLDASRNVFLSDPLNKITIRRKRKKMLVLGCFLLPLCFHFHYSDKKFYSHTATIIFTNVFVKLFLAILFATLVLRFPHALLYHMSISTSLIYSYFVHFVVVILLLYTFRLRFGSFIELMFALQSNNNHLMDRSLELCIFFIVLCFNIFSLSLSDVFDACLKLPLYVLFHCVEFLLKIARKAHIKHDEVFNSKPSFTNFLNFFIKDLEGNFVLNKFKSEFLNFDFNKDANTEQPADKEGQKLEDRYSQLQNAVAAKAKPSVRSRKVRPNKRK
ncbi:hypothetical protein PCE1_003583 [Barthelona sp. PCE]